jgi:hypothetical protein
MDGELDEKALDAAVEAHLTWKPDRKTRFTVCQDFGMQQREIIRYQTEAAIRAYLASEAIGRA